MKTSLTENKNHIVLVNFQICLHKAALVKTNIPWKIGRNGSKTCRPEQTSPEKVSKDEEFQKNAYMITKNVQTKQTST